MKNYKKLPIDPTPTPPMLIRTTVICPLTREKGRVRRGWWVRVKNVVFGHFLENLKITTNWPPLDERVRSSFAESCKNESHYLEN